MAGKLGSICMHNSGHAFKFYITICNYKIIQNLDKFEGSLRRGKSVKTKGKKSSFRREQGYV